MCRGHASVNIYAGIDVSRETQIPSASLGVRLFHVNHLVPTAARARSFADTKLRKDDIEQILDIHGSHNST
jgi:hypothetical protein